LAGAKARQPASPGEYFSSGVRRTFIFMDDKLKTNPLKLICLNIIQMVKRVLPKIVANTIKQRRQQAFLNELEVERLDRIRNPSKYLGR
jgi:hypothetical protein